MTRCRVEQRSIRTAVTKTWTMDADDGQCLWCKLTTDAKYKELLLLCFLLRSAVSYVSFVLIPL